MYLVMTVTAESTPQGDSTYAITKSGLLCEFNNRRLLDKWVELRTTRLEPFYYLLSFLHTFLPPTIIL